MKLPTRALALVLATALLAAAAAGAAAYAGVLAPRPLASTAAEEHVLEVYEMELDQPVTTGRLDLRIDEGAARVVGWEKNAYRVVVYQTGGADALSDHQTTVEFTDASTEGVLDLSIVVDRRGTYAASAGADGMRLGDRAERAIVAFVPASALYESVFACSGQSHTFLPGDDTIPLVPASRTDSCVPGESGLGGGVIHVNVVASGKGLNLTSGAEGIRGDKLEILSDYGDISVAGVDFETITVASSHGDIELEGDARQLSAASSYGDVAAKGDFGKLALATSYGDIALAGAFREASVATSHGDVSGWLSPTASGALDVATSYGDVTLQLARPAGVGYALEATTSYGDIEVLLADAKVERQTDDEDDRRHHGDHVTAVTAGFGRASAQVTLAISTSHGDVLVTDGSGLATEDKDDGGSGSTAPSVPALPLR